MSDNETLTKSPKDTTIPMYIFLNSITDDQIKLLTCHMKQHTKDEFLHHLHIAIQTRMLTLKEEEDSLVAQILDGGGQCPYVYTPDMLEG